MLELCFKAGCLLLANGGNTAIGGYTEFRFFLIFTFICIPSRWNDYNIHIICYLGTSSFQSSFCLFKWVAVFLRAFFKAKRRRKGDLFLFKSNVEIDRDVSRIKKIDKRKHVIFNR
jgi:hypothetical protein